MGLERNLCDLKGAAGEDRIERSQRRARGAGREGVGCPRLPYGTNRSVQRTERQRQMPRVTFHLDLGSPYAYLAADGFELLEGPAPGTKLVADPPATLADGQSFKERSP